MKLDDKEVYLLDKPLKIINIGLEIFRQSLLTQCVEVLQVDWRPPAGGDEKLASILEKLL